MMALMHCDDLRIVELLLEHKDTAGKSLITNVDQRNQHGDTALMWACKYGRLDAARYLLHDAGADALWQACAAEKLPQLTELFMSRNNIGDTGIFAALASFLAPWVTLSQKLFFCWGGSASAIFCGGVWPVLPAARVRSARDGRRAVAALRANRVSETAAREFVRASRRRQPRRRPPDETKTINET